MNKQEPGRDPRKFTVARRARLYLFTGLTVIGLTVSFSASANVIQYDAYATSIGGYFNGSSGNIVGNGGTGSGTNCSSAGTVPLQITVFNTGNSAPSGGVGPCGYYGGSVQNVGSTKQTAATGPVAGTYFNGASSFSGSASAAAGSSAKGAYVLSTSATGTQLGSTGPGAFSYSGAAAAVDDPNWVVHCPSCSVGEILNMTFNWTIDNLSASSNQDPSQLLGDFYINLYSYLNDSVNNGTAHTDWSVNFNNGGPGSVPSWSCGVDPVCPSFNTFPGGFSGSSTLSFRPAAFNAVIIGAGLTGTADAQFAFTVQTAYTATVDPDFTLTGITFKDNNGTAVNGVTVTTSNGIYSDAGYTDTTGTPEPASILLCGLGLGVAAIFRAVAGGKK